MRNLLVACVVILVAGGSARADKMSAAELAKARVEAAAQAYAAAEARLATGQVGADAVYTWSVRWFVAQRDQPLKGKALRAAAADHLTRMTELEAKIDAAVDAGTASAADKAATIYYRVEAELWVARKGK